ncbi:cell division protein FtsX [Anaerocolumna xylanovorans]|uniref:Cell division protein FtsX n=1 Tax=Anaerocolumna xylanovorans DSM 12503 TaxID=1121345 RepID=A0A1M7XZW9_9FIRM|nr:permease-like cell division protein FtsX [Anaerocolumna xylanovorans]SHO44765.1 cell division protein FtsX [Anaerocolumna xylanovorans DSM 12503]
MKKYLKNTGYFLKETLLLFKGQLAGNLVSLIGTALLLMLLGLMLTGSGAAKELTEGLKEEAEINVYPSDGAFKDMDFILKSIQHTQGVRKATLIDKEEAYKRMGALLKEDAAILDVFEKNPLEPFIEVNVSLKDSKGVVEHIKAIPGVDYVRDNEEILMRIKGISDFTGKISLFVLMAVSITTFIILSHMIRQGIYKNREQIKTLRLLGASEVFIGIPYVLYGVLFNLAGGILASLVLKEVISSIYASMNLDIPFLPLPDKEMLIPYIRTVLLGYSAVLGLIVSLTGVPSVADKRRGRRKKGR